MEYADFYLSEIISDICEKRFSGNNQSSEKKMVYILAQFNIHIPIFMIFLDWG